jgi:hypothetical protein
VGTLRSQQKFAWFDAYYNQQRQSVQTNIMCGYQQEAMFPFSKCMASQGFPLGEPDSQNQNAQNQNARGFAGDELRRFLSTFQRSNCAARDASLLSDDELKGCLGIQ